MKKIIFDSSTIISFTDGCLLGTLKFISEKLGIEIIIPEYVAVETIDKPLNISRFKLHALRIKKAISEGWIKVHKINPKSKEFVRETMNYFNNLYFIKGMPLQIIQEGEIEALALIKELNSKILAIDERTTRLLIERPEGLKTMLENRHKQKITINKNNLSQLKETFKDLTVIRSTELVGLAFKKKLINKNMLEGILLALKYNGCGISEREIKEFAKETR